MNNQQIAIIGGGASGLLASILLARSGKKITLFEKNHKLGRKILATGNGKCNISNSNISSKNFYTTNKDFLEYILNQFDYLKFKKLFLELGLEIIENKDGKAYPSTLQASSVVNLLVYEAKRLNVEFVLDANVEDISYTSDKFQINFNNTTRSFDKTIIASGTKAMPKLGSCDSGFDFATYFGHTIIEPFASLVQLCSDDKKIYDLNGVKVDCEVTLEVDKQFCTRASGDVLFTNYGLSGNAILDISREASYNLSIQSGVVVKIDIFPSINKDNLTSQLLKRLQNSNNKDKYFWLEGFLHSKLIPYVIDNCGIKKTKLKANELNKKDIITLVYFMKNIKIDISNTKGFDTAEVSAGGVDVSQIDKKTMQSNLQKDLYFIGEVVDIDGQCGGFNLHWAWASAFVCANAIK